MTNLPSSKSADPSSTGHLQASVDAQAIAALNAAANGRPIEQASLHPLPSIVGCQRVIALVQDLLREQMTWNPAVAMATRIVSCTVARKTEAEDTAVIIAELARALCQYPADVARHACDRIVETHRFRPPPADVHDIAKERLTQLRCAMTMAERVIAERERRSAMRRAAAEEAEEEARAIAEGRETPAARRARVAQEARDLIRGKWPSADTHHRA